MIVNTHPVAQCCSVSPHSCISTTQPPDVGSLTSTSASPQRQTLSFTPSLLSLPLPVLSLMFLKHNRWSEGLISQERSTARSPRLIIAILLLFFFTTDIHYSEITQMLYYYYQSFCSRDHCRLPGSLLRFIKSCRTIFVDTFITFSNFSGLFVLRWLALACTSMLRSWSVMKNECIHSIEVFYISALSCNFVTVFKDCKQKCNFI